MTMDIIAGAIIIVSALVYARKGFALSVISVLQWFVGCMAGLLFCHDIGIYLAGKTSFGQSLYAKYDLMIQEGIENYPAIESIPKHFYGWVQDDAEYITDISPDMISSIVLTILAFVIITLVIRLLFILYSRFFIREHHHGIVAYIDTVCGVILGTLMGFFFIFLLFAFLYAWVGLTSPEQGMKILSTADSSSFSGDLFLNNPFIRLIRQILA